MSRVYNCPCDCDVCTGLVPMRGTEPTDDGPSLLSRIATLERVMPAVFSLLDAAYEAGLIVRTAGGYQISDDLEWLPGTDTESIPRWRALLEAVKPGEAKE